MASPINIQIISDATGAVKGITDVDEALGKAAVQLDRVAQQGDATTAELLRDYQRQTQGIQTESQRQVGYSKRAQEEAARNSKETGRQIREEATQNAAETFSSFDGSATSLVSGIQGTFGGLVASLDPKWAALAAAGGIAIGLIQSAITNTEQDTEDFKQKVADLGSEFIETGSVGKASIGFIADKLKELATTGDSSGLTLANIRKEAKDIHVPFDELARSYAGGTDKLDAQIETVKRLRKENSDRELEEARLLGTVVTGQTAKDLLYEKELKSLNKIKEANESAAQEARDYAGAGIPQLLEKQHLQDQLVESLKNSSTETSKYLDTEKGIFDVKGYIQSMTARAKALDEYKAHLEGSGLSTAAKEFLDAQGADTASLLLEGYRKSSSRQKAELDRIWTASGASSGQSYTTSFQEELNGTPLTPKVKAPQVDVPNLLRGAQRTLDSNPLKLGIVFTDKRNGKRLT